MTYTSACNQQAPVAMMGIREEVLTICESSTVTGLSWVEPAPPPSSGNCTSHAREQWSMCHSPRIGSPAWGLDASLCTALPLHRTHTARSTRRAHLQHGAAWEPCTTMDIRCCSILLCFGHAARGIFYDRCTFSIYRQCRECMECWHSRCATTMAAACPMPGMPFSLTFNTRTGGARQETPEGMPTISTCRELGCCKSYNNSVAHDYTHWHGDSVDRGKWLSLCKAHLLGNNLAWRSLPFSSPVKDPVVKRNLIKA